MISRRNFLKLAGLSTVAVGSGYLTGKMTQTSKPVHYSIHGFVPEDELVINTLVKAFKVKIKSNSEPIIISDSKLGEVITRFDLDMRRSNYSDKGEITYTLKKLNKPIDSDIIVSDKDNSIYSLDDLNLTIGNLRNDLTGRKADYIFTAEYSKTDLFSSVFKSNKEEVIIENEKGLAERISLNKNYNNIIIGGPQGKTELEIRDKIVRVNKSTCRHEICKQTIAHDVGNIIACAPNKVLVRIV